MEGSEVLGRPWYNDSASITKRVITLQDFHDLVSARRDAGHNRRERLEWFILLGRFVLDRSGNVGKVNGEYVPADAHPNFPRVMNEQEFDRFRQDQGTGGRHFNYGAGNVLPPHHVTCPGCGQRWAIETCHQMKRHSRDKNIELDPFIGQTLGDVKRALRARTDALYLIQSDFAIQHKDEKIFLGEHEGINDGYVICAGDIASANVWIYEHPVCHYRRLEAELREQFAKVFADAGFDDVVLDPTENGYDSDNHSSPWFNAYTPWGPIRVGWRSQVIHISWPDLRAPNVMPLFEGEIATKGPTLIHAWSYQKATDYLLRIRCVLD